jgi:hypothetical protein
MSNKNKIIIAVVGIALIGTYFYVKKILKDGGVTKKDENLNLDTGGSTVNTITNASPMSADQNFANLKVNIGVSTPSGNSFTLKFNEGKNLVTFYNNSRFAIFNSKKEQLFKGSYQQGGKILKGDNGKEAVSGSIWRNLLSIIK